jgi:hypothetical protein
VADRWPGLPGAAFIVHLLGQGEPEGNLSRRAVQAYFAAHRLASPARRVAALSV